MAGEDLAQELLATDRLRRALEVIAAKSLIRDLPTLEPIDPLPRPDWGYALTCASVLAQVNVEEAQEAALRVAQGCIAGDDAEKHHRAAAAVLLERMGNRLALRLAATRTSIDEDTWIQAPVPLKLDVIRRRLELAIPVTARPTIAGNVFQREFWTVLERARWVSVSAPTSAGKSFIVKQWFAERISRVQQFKGVYLVPTRALIEEVSAELRADLPPEVGVYSIPWDSGIGSCPHEVHVVTQERLHFLHDRLPDFAADLLFIDEAQKLGDGRRGVLLQRVLGDAALRNPALQVVFASPMSKNPEILLEDGDPGGCSIAAETVTVNQNLVWADQVPFKPLQWQASLVLQGTPNPVGRFTLPARPTSKGKRLSLVAVALGGQTAGNVVYASGAADAEKAASQIYDMLGPEADVSDRQDIGALIELIRYTIHRQYVLASVLKRGVAFHYGNMPLLVRREIERLFREGTLRYLVCTSTLLEGVNLPCRNLFARAPRKGRGNLMSAPDFWNLAGRAGRWGKEFEGNIVCVDASDDRIWPDPPRQRERSPLSRAADVVFADLARLRAYIEGGAQPEEARRQRLDEDVFSLLAARVSEGRPIDSLPGMPPDSPEMPALTQAIADSLAAMELPTEFILRHAGISPPAMQRLLEYMRGHPDQDALLLAQPESFDAAVSYHRALGRCNNTLGADFGGDKRRFQLAILIVEWMRGSPLAVLIAKRIEISAKRNDPNLSRDIRGTMADVEEVARFSAPRYLACYLDILKFHLVETGRADDVSDLPDVSMMLELGVARTTEVSLMTLGLSRASAVALEPYIMSDELTPAQCVTWIAEATLEGFELPHLVREEIRRVMEAARAPR